MRFDIENSKKEFLKYTENYDLENEHIERKQLHSLRVMEISKQISEKLGLTQEENELASLIGLLHDIARFEQYTQYKTFKDLQSFDHGDFGAKILRNDIRKYIETNQYDEIIIKAVKNHNKFKIEEGIAEKEELFSKIIRDADKIDIFYESVEMFWKGKEKEVEESVISKDMIEQFKILSQKKRKVEETTLDKVIRVITFIFDVNFKSSLQIIKEEDYINKILNRYNFKDERTRQQVEEIRIIANEYMNRKLKEGK